MMISIDPIIGVKYIFYSLDLAPPSKTYQYDDKIGFLGEGIVIECPAQSGKTTWSVSVTEVYL